MALNRRMTTLLLGVAGLGRWRQLNRFRTGHFFEERNELGMIASQDRIDLLDIQDANWASVDVR